MLDFPISMGGYKFSSNPDEPIIVHIERFAKGADPDASPREQRLAGRRELYSTSYETVERETRKQLAGALAGGDFDPREYIAAITVNRWAHGYAYGNNPFSEQGYEKDKAANVLGRQALGRISIANSDAGADVDTAIEQAYRAVEELVT